MGGGSVCVCMSELCVLSSGRERGDCFLRCVIEIGGGDDGETAVSEDLQACLYVGAFQSHDERKLEVRLLARSHNTVGDGCAVNNATEDVDKDCLHLRVARDDIERCCDSLGRHTTPTIQKVGGLSSVQLNDIHRCHRKASAIDQASDVAVHTHVVEPELARRNFTRVLFARVDVGEDVFLSEGRVCVESNLCVKANNTAVRSGGERVDLDLGGINIHEQSVEFFELVCCLYGLVTLELEVVSHLAGLRISDSNFDVDRNGVDGVGVRSCNLFDVNTSFRAANHHRAHVLSVHEDGEVFFARNVQRLCHHELVDRDTAWRSLLCHQIVPQHLFSHDADGCWIATELNSAFESTAERSLTTTSGKDLCFHHDFVNTKIFGKLFSFFSSRCSFEFLNVDAFLLHQFFALVFVKIDEPLLLLSGGCDSKRAHRAGGLSEH
eukprot:m.256629 g.256629  ORF g.256629 m.256629 type:complete len:437 (-) comp34539_c0_seq1:56-1366(-)